MKNFLTEDIIIKKWDNKFRVFSFSAKRKYIFDIKLKLSEITDPQKSKKLKDKYDKKFKLYLSKKKSDYDRKCNLELEKFRENKLEGPKKQQPRRNNMLNKLLSVLQLFSKLRDSDKYGYGYCISCGKKIHYKDGHGGHFISRMFKSVCANLYNINLQCSECNHISGVSFGEESDRIQKFYRDALVRKHGLDIVIDLETTKDKEISNPAKYGKVTMDFIIEELEYYTPLVKKMESEKLKRE